jgi:hypothetical protein
MTSKTTAMKLQALGFRYVEDETGQFYGHSWTGTLEPLVDCEIDGEPFTGIRVGGNTRADMDSRAIIEINSALELMYEV